jgi:hypothetical protein
MSSNRLAVVHIGGDIITSCKKCLGCFPRRMPQTTSSRLYSTSGRLSQMYGTDSLCLQNSSGNGRMQKRMIQLLLKLFDVFCKSTDLPALENLPRCFVGPVGLVKLVNTGVLDSMCSRRRRVLENGRRKWIFDSRALRFPPKC